MTKEKFETGKPFTAPVSFTKADLSCCLAVVVLGTAPNEEPGNPAMPVTIHETDTYLETGLPGTEADQTIFFLSRLAVTAIAEVPDRHARLRLIGDAPIFHPLTEEVKLYAVQLDVSTPPGDVSEDWTGTLTYPPTSY